MTEPKYNVFKLKGENVSLVHPALAKDELYSVLNALHEEFLAESVRLVKSRQSVWKVESENNVWIVEYLLDGNEDSEAKWTYNPNYFYFVVLEE